MTSQTERLAYILAGPCGVGKSTIADLVASSCEITHVDFDKIRLNDAKKRMGNVSPCSISYLDLERCLKEALTQYARGFVLDLGGDSVFRQDKNNFERLQQIFWLKRFFGAQVVVLFAQKKILQQRFLAVKSRKMPEFNAIWESWLQVEYPYWQKCGDRFIDTTDMKPETIAELVHRLQ